MASNEIVEKLNKLIAQPDVFLHEKDVVYFFVQIRKLMEREDIFNDHKAVKFYCDWIVHPQKNRHHNDIAEIYEEIYHNCVKYCNEMYDDESDGILALLKFESLKSELEPLLSRFGLSVSAIDNSWARLTKCLLGILKDQPLINESGENVKELIITNADENLFAIKITFTQPIVDNRGYRHSNFTYGLSYISQTRQHDSLGGR